MNDISGTAIVLKDALLRFLFDIHHFECHSLQLFVAQL